MRVLHRSSSVSVLVLMMWCGGASALAQSITPPEPQAQLPRHATFVLDPAESSVELSLFYGGSRSKLAGRIQLYLGDPSVPVIAIVGMVGLSVDRAELVAVDFEPDLLGQPEPLRMIQDPNVRSIGSWLTTTGHIAFDLHLIAANTASTTGGLPVPMPIHVTGNLAQGVLKATGTNGNIPDGTIRLQLKAFETPLPPHVVDVWFSTNSGFHPGKVSSDVAKPGVISDGDLLSARGYVVRTNHQLTARLGIMPVVPDLGLDAVMPAPRGETWFSFKREAGSIWSETLGCWLTHGDLLSDRGYVVISHEKLVGAFEPLPTRNTLEPGLDAIHRGPNREMLFSTDEGFYSVRLNQYVGHGDLLSTRGRVVRTNAQLLANFKIVDMTMRPVPMDYGLDAVAVRSNSEIWFSTKVGFIDERYGWVSDGDLLSTTGQVVVRNLALVSGFEPLEDLANFGLDAITWALPSRVGDFDFDGDVDRDDLGAFESAISGPALATPNPDCGDMDGDGDTDQTDFGILQRCLGGVSAAAESDCED